MYLIRSDLELVHAVALSRGCSLDVSPGSNWVQEAGGLPDGICRAAKEIMKTGKARSNAIAIAVNKAKEWALKSKDPKTRAKWAAEVAAWEKLKAKNAKREMSATALSADAQSALVLSLTSTPFSLTKVQAEFAKYQDERIKKWRQARRAEEERGGEYLSPPLAYGRLSVQEVWTDHIIAKRGYEAPEFVKVPYVVDDSGAVRFGAFEKVEIAFVPVPEVSVELSVTDEVLRRRIDVALIAESGDASCRRVAALTRVMNASESM